MFRPSVFDPLVGTRTIEAALGGDHQACRIRMQRLGNDLFAHEGTVGIRSVDEIDSQFHSAPYHSYGLGPVRGFAPDSFTRDSHCAIPKPRDARRSQPGLRRAGGAPTNNEAFEGVRAWELPSPL